MDVSSSEGSNNTFANDGSFFDQFRKKMANQSKTSDHVTAIPCPKQKAGFKPKTGFKPINLKASLKKQINTVAIKKQESRGKPSEVSKEKNRVENETVFERNIEEEKKVLKRLADVPTPLTEPSEDQSEGGERKRKRKSRWGIVGPIPPAIPAPPAPPAIPAIPATPVIPVQQPVVAIVNGAPVTLPPAVLNTSVSSDVTARALATLLKTKSKYEYDSDEETENGTWEHKQRAAELKATQDAIKAQNEIQEGKHHLGDFLPTEELEKFMTRASALKTGAPAPPALPSEATLSSDNIGYKMLQNAGWQEGQGLGALGNGIVNPIDRGMMKMGTSGLGMAKPNEPLPTDDEFDVYRKRMMLAYKYRPNPMNNPRRAYY